MYSISRITEGAGNTKRAERSTLPPSSSTIAAVSFQTSRIARGMPITPRGSYEAFSNSTFLIIASEYVTYPFLRIACHLLRPPQVSRLAAQARGTTSQSSVKEHDIAPAFGLVLGIHRHPAAQNPVLRTELKPNAPARIRTGITH